MDINQSLAQLNYLQLHTLLEHLRLGEAHLKRQLDLQQFKELLQIGSLSAQQSKRLHSNQIERVGSFVPLLNTIVSSLLGGWLGFAGFMRLHIGSVPILITVVVLMLLIGGYVGYASFCFTRNQARQAIIQQKLNNAQLELLRLLQQKRQQSISRLVHRFNRLADKFVADAVQIPLTEAVDKEHLKGWWEKLYQGWIVQGQALATHIQSAYTTLLQKTYQRMQCLLGGHQLLTAKISPSMIAALLSVKPAAQLLNRSKINWLRRNALSLLLVLAPTLLGSAASMFVYLCGIPDLSKALGKYHVAETLSLPAAKIIMLIFAISAVVYFLCAQTYANYKNYQRQREISNSQQLITQQENILLQANARLVLLHKTNSQVSKVNTIRSFINTITKVENG